MRNAKKNDRHNEIANKVRTHSIEVVDFFLLSFTTIFCTCYYMALDISNLRVFTSKYFLKSLVESIRIRVTDMLLLFLSLCLQNNNVLKP